MKARLFISATIFILLTAVRIFSPESALQLHDTILPKMTGGEDFRSVVIALGSKLTGDDDIFYASKDSEQDLPIEYKSEKVDISADFKIEEMINDNISGFLSENKVDNSEILTEEAATATEESVEEPSVTTESEITIEIEAGSEDDNKAQKLEAFLETQSEFSDYELPVSVSYDIPTIAFECVRPCEAAISSAFGYRIHPIQNEVKFHYGSDYALYDGDSVLAFASGQVISVQELSGYGHTLIIEHPDGFTSLYAHLSQTLVNVGDKVSIGKKVALSGHSGDTTGPHLHFEVEKSGVRYNPELCF